MDFYRELGPTGELFCLCASCHVVHGPFCVCVSQRSIRTPQHAEFISIFCNAECFI